MPKITVANDKKDIETPTGENLRQALTSGGVQVYSGINKYINCFGNGLCGTCKVLVKKGMENLTPKTTREKFTLFHMLSAIGHEDEMRLSCQCQVNGDVTLEARPPLNLSGEGKPFWEKPYPNK